MWSLNQDPHPPLAFQLRKTETLPQTAIAENTGQQQKVHTLGRRDFPSYLSVG